MTSASYIIDSADTREVEPGQGADYWAATIDAYQGRMSYGFRHRDDFRGSIVRQRSSNYQLTGWKTDAIVYARTDRDIRVAADPDYRFLFSDSGQLHLQVRESHACLEPNTALLTTVAEPFKMSPQPGMAGFAFTVPYRDIERRLGPTPPQIVRIDFTVGLGRVVGDLSRALFQERETLTQAHFDAVCETLVELLCMLAVGDDRPTAPSHLSEVAAMVRRYVRRHAADPTLDGRAIAGALGWSLRQIQLALQQTGTTPRQLIKEERLRLAKERLQSPVYRDYTITQLAYQLGFSSVSAFSNAFREQFGHPPSDFRRR
ncbi:helix-turn-helix transcriptional regulator [Nocardia araoensis]|uniref:helix-turn-helix transcriptional regulator n=1 Tax=Nocardia araoensis TaxID=228600 RepID=UPI00031D75AD|nr:AraC family transcriptional regulator [Nocardia araoensis]